MAKLSLKDVESVVCRRFNLTAEEIRSDSRARRIARPRQIAMFLARERTAYSFPTIAKHFGCLDHATVISGCDRIAAMMVSNPKIAAYVQECRAAIPEAEARAAARKAKLQFWAQRLSEGVASWPADMPPPVSMIPPPFEPEQADAVATQQS